ncbi:MAG: hypothetical protein ACP5FK_03330 [bacterium]
MVISKTRIIISIIAIFAVFLAGCSKKPSDPDISDSVAPFINQDDSTTAGITTGIAGIEFTGNTINVYLSVKSTENFPVDSLWAGNFDISEIYDNGQGGLDTVDLIYEDLAVTKHTFSDNSNVSIILLKSNSSTVSAYGTNMNTGMKLVANEKRAADSLAVLAFHSYDTLLTDFTRNIALIEGAIDEPDYWGRSCQFRALYRAIDELMDQTGRKGIIVFGDGLNNEDPSEQNAVIDSLVNCNIPVYFVVYGDTPDTNCLETICNQTGGFYTYYRTSASMWAMMDDIRNNYDLYKISWTRRTPSGRRGIIDISTQYQSAIGISSSTALYYFEAP